jgi:hypothetical protein
LRPSKLILVSLSATAAIAAVAQAPRYEATLICPNATLKAYLNNIGQVVYTDRTFTQPFSRTLRNPDGTKIQSWVGPLNDHGSVITNRGGGLTIFNALSDDFLTGGIRLTVPPIFGDWFGTSLSNNNIVLASGTNFSNPVTAVFTNATTPIVYQGSDGSSGNAVGDTSYYSVGQQAGFVRRVDGTEYRVPVPEPNFSVNDINDMGDVITSTIAGNSFLFDRNNQLLATPRALPGYTVRGNSRMNNRREVVWSSAPSMTSTAEEQRAVYWNSITGPILLDTLVSNLPTGKRLAGTFDINNRGDILAFAVNENTVPSGQGELYLVRPVPEPATMAGLGAGLLALLRRRKKRRS